MSEASAVPQGGATPEPAAASPGAVDTGGAAAPSPQSAPSPQQGATTWTTGMADDLRGFAENKGWQDPSAVVTSYKNLEKMVGAPPESLIRLPKEMTPEAFSEIAGKLGRPEKPEGYEFKLPDGQQEFGEFLKNASHSANLTKGQAEAFVGQLMEKTTAHTRERAEARQAKNAEERTALTKEWGAAFDQNLNTARNAAREFGMTEQQINALEQVLGFKGTHALLYNIGSKIGEAQYVDNNTGGGGFNRPMSPAAAQAALAEFTASPEFKAAYYDNQHPSHKAVVEKKSRLNAMAYPS